MTRWRGGGEVGCWWEEATEPDPGRTCVSMKMWSLWSEMMMIPPAKRRGVHLAFEGYWVGMLVGMYKRWGYDVHELLVGIGANITLL